MLPGAADMEDAHTEWALDRPGPWELLVFSRTSASLNFTIASQRPEVIAVGISRQRGVSGAKWFPSIR
jgi:hypothetical protein